MRRISLLTLLLCTSTAPAQPVDPNSPAGRSAANGQILAGQIAAEIQTLHRLGGSLPDQPRVDILLTCEACIDKAVNLQRSISTLQPFAVVQAQFRDLDAATDVLIAKVRQADPNNLPLMTQAGRIDYSCNRLGAALNLGIGSSGGFPGLIASGGNFTDPQRETLRRLARSLDSQAELLLAIARSTVPADRLGKTLEDQVRVFARSADKVAKALDGNAPLDLVRREFGELQQRWDAASQTVNGIGLAPYPQVRGQAGRVAGIYTTLAAVLSNAPPAPPVPGPGPVPTFPVNNHRDRGLIVFGAGEGGQPIVRVCQDRRGLVHNDFMAYDASFRGGVRVAVGDVNGDGIVDIITAPGPGGPPLVRVFDGRDLSLLSQFYAFDPLMNSGVYVAAADVTRDGRAEIVTGAGDGGGPHVRAFDGLTGQLKTEFFAYDQRATCGARVALGDVDGDGIFDIITAPGVGAEPLVRVFNGRNLKPISEWHAYDRTFLGGVFVAAADCNGNGRAEVVTGAGTNGGPHVRMFDPTAGRLLGEFFAYDRNFLGGVRVALFDSERSRQPNILTAPGPGPTPLVRIYSARDGQLVNELTAYDPRFTGGVYVAGN